VPEDWSGDEKDVKGGCSGVEWVDSSVVLCSCMLTLSLSSEMCCEMHELALKCSRQNISTAFTAVHSSHFVIFIHSRILQHLSTFCYPS